MINLSKTTLLSILLAVFIIAAGFFAYQWWQVKGELIKQIEQSENLMKQIDELQKEIEGKKAEVAITTDKTEYEQGEIIRFTVKNSKNESIRIAGLLGISKKIEGEWVDAGYDAPCLKPGVMREAPATEAPSTIRIEAKGEYKENWDQYFCDTTLMKYGTALPGTYRIEFFCLEGDGFNIFSNEFIIK